MSNKSSELELLEKLNVDVAIIKEKLPLLDKDLDAFSLETVKMFHRDALAAGYSILPKKSLASA